MNRGNLSVNFLKSVKKSRFFQKTFLSYILVSCILFFIFQFINFYNIDANYRNTLNNMVLDSMKQADSVNTSILSSLHNQVTLMLSDDTGLINLIYQEDYPISAAMNSRKIYSEIKGMHSSIHSVSLLNFKTETALTDRSRTPLDQFDDDDLLSFIDSSKPSHSPYMLIPRKLGKTYVLTLLYYNYKEGALAINLDYDKYLSLLNLYSSYENINIRMANTYGNVIFSTDKTQFGSKLSEDPDYTYSDLHKKSPNGTYLMEESKADTTILLTGNSFGITYYAQIKHAVFNPNNPILTANILYSVIYLIVCLILSLLLSFITYFPLYRLNSGLYNAVNKGTKSEISPPENGNPGGKQDDIADLFDFYQKLIENNQELSQNKNDLLIHEMLTPAFGTFPLPSDTEGILQVLFPHKGFFTLIALVDMQPDSSLSKEEIALYHYSIQNIMEELLETDRVVIKSVSTTGSERLVMILNFEEYPGKSILAAIQNVQDIMLSQFDISISFSMGDVIWDVNDIYTSYHEARKRISYRFLAGKNAVISSDSILKYSDSSEYPSDIVKQIVLDLKHYNDKKAIENVNKFFDIIRTSQLHTAREYILRLLSTLIQSTSCIEASASLDIMMTDFFDYTIDDIRRLIIVSCQAVKESELEAKLHTPDKTDLINRIKLLVNEKLNDNMMSVAMIADEVGLSVNYVRSIFKNAENETLSTYITRMRIESICTQLSQTDLSIQEISLQMGFTNKTYFYSFFKKHVGMTPMQYKKEKRDGTISKE